MALLKIILYQPLLNLAVFLYSIVPGGDFGIAIVILTVLVRIILFPLSVKTARSQRELQQLQPKLKEVQERFKNNKPAQTEAIMALYREHKINPLLSLLPLLIQLPILIALYQVFINIFKPETLSLLYGFISHPAVINTHFLGIMDIDVPNKYLAIFAGIAQFIQSKALQHNAGGTANAMVSGKSMLYFFPAMIILIGWNLPAGLVLYIITSTLFSVLEQFYIKRFA